MHGVRMTDYTCNGGVSRGGRDNNMNKFSRHIQKWHCKHSETLLRLVNEQLQSRTNNRTHTTREKQHAIKETHAQTKQWCWSRLIKLSTDHIMQLLNQTGISHNWSPKKKKALSVQLNHILHCSFTVCHCVIICSQCSGKKTTFRKCALRIACLSWR